MCSSDCWNPREICFVRTIAKNCGDEFADHECLHHYEWSSYFQQHDLIDLKWVVIASRTTYYPMYRPGTNGIIPLCPRAVQPRIDLQRRQYLYSTVFYESLYSLCWMPIIRPLCEYTARWEFILFIQVAIVFSHSYTTVVSGMTWQCSYMTMGACNQPVATFRQCEPMKDIFLKCMFRRRFQFRLY